jgi:hypothetical protein
MQKKRKKRDFQLKVKRFFMIIKYFFFLFFSAIFRRLEELFSLHQPINRTTIVRDHLSFLVSARDLPEKNPPNKKKEFTTKAEIENAFKSLKILICD